MTSHDRGGATLGIVDEVTAAVKRWPEFAAKAELSEQWLRKIQKQQRLDFSKV